MSAAAVVSHPITVLPPGPERKELTTELLDRGRTYAHAPVSAQVNGEGAWESPGIDFSDYGRMYSFNQKLEACRRLDTPEWALRPALLRQVIVHYVERRAGFKKPLPGTERERLARASQRNAERCKMNEAVLRNLCVRFVELKKANADPAALAMLKIQITNLDTRLLIDKTVAGIAVRAVHLYYGAGLDSVAVADELGIKPPHVRALIWKLNWIWDKLNGVAKPRNRRSRRTARPHFRVDSHKAAQMLAEGRTYEQVGRAFGVHGNEILLAVKYAGLWIQRRRGCKPNKSAPEIARMAAEGISYAIIAKKFGVSRMQIYRRLKKAQLWKPRRIWDKPSMPRVPHQKGRSPYLEHQQFNADIAIGLYLAGKSVPEIARSFGYAPGTGQNRTRTALIQAGVYKRKS